MNASKAIYVVCGDNNKTRVLARRKQHIEGRRPRVAKYYVLIDAACLVGCPHFSTVVDDRIRCRYGGWYDKKQMYAASELDFILVEQVTPAQKEAAARIRVKGLDLQQKLRDENGASLLKEEGAADVLKRMREIEEKKGFVRSQ